MRPFRFGLQTTTAQEVDPIAAGRRAEAAGFDVLLVSDHVGPGRSPLPMLAAVAATTSTLRLGTLVLNADMRNPVQLAWDVTTIDHLSGGRFELGLGAGHTPHEYAETGIELRPPAVRKAAMAEQVEIIRRLLDGETVDWDGEHHQIAGAKLDRSAQDRLPILVGGNGDALLRHAARHADIIGLQGLGRTHDDGHRHDVKWSTEHLDAQLACLRAAAGDRFDDLELNALVQVVDVTDDAAGAIEELCARIDGLDPDELLTTPYVLIGTVGEIVEKLHACRERWGITYFAVRE
ncbi:MAG: TIGR03621 family F420-dependent LLM class oxidoreductase, partial [Ilumatobacter sp.]|nr:TIGR03621 family F420-dependent LLM class oxidoreductase [Ilumatobacter sp.]